MPRARKRPSPTALREQLEYEQLLQRTLDDPEDEEALEALRVATALREKAAHEDDEEP